MHCAISAQIRLVITNPIKNVFIVLITWLTPLATVSKREFYNFRNVVYRGKGLNGALHVLSIKHFCLSLQAVLIINHACDRFMFNHY